MYAFEYQRPADRAAAIAAAAADDARYLAGGQSLVQSMRLRLGNPATLIDLSGMADLRGIRRNGDTLSIGAMTRHSEVARSAEVRSAIQMVRSLATIGGALANSDPAACYPAGVLGLGATIRTDRRSIAADDFFIDLFTTALEPGELIVGVDFPVPARAGYVKFKQPASRFALIGVFVSQSAAGVRVAVTGAKACVYRVPEFERALAARFEPEALDGVAVSADGLNGDLHASAEYRAAMINVMAKRAVEQALGR